MPPREAPPPMPGDQPDAKRARVGGFGDEFVLQPEEEFLQEHTGECVRAFVGVMHACVYRGFVLEIVKDKSVGVLRAQHDAHMTT